MKFLRLGGVVFAGLVLSVVFAASAHAASFNINTTDDGNDANPGDSVCEINVGVGDCGLRALIEETNSLGGTNSGIFDISGATVHTFTPATPYPGITNSLTLDAITSQDGAQCNTLVPTSLPSANTPHSLMIEIDGTAAISGSNQGVLEFSNVSASSSTIRGLVINRASSFNGSAIYMDTDSITDITIECNYLGTNPSGTTASANVYGISVSGTDINNLTVQNNLITGNSSNNIYFYGNGTGTGMVIQNNLFGTNAAGTNAIGSTTGQSVYVSNTEGVTANHNVFSGNDGVGFQYTSSRFLTFQGNYVGLNVLGSPLGNGSDGVVFYASIDMTIGGTSLANRNVISANSGSGIHVYNDCSGNTGSASNSEIYNNYVGTNTSGTVQSGYGNNGAGIEVNEYYGGCVSVYNHQIGGDSTGQPNIIAGNTDQGVLIHQALNQDVFSITSIANSIYGNGQFGIDLAFDSDDNSGTADTDLGPNPINNILMAYPTAGSANYYLNHPTLNSSSFSGNQVSVNYNFQANGVDGSSWPYLIPSNLVGYRLDFYLNDAGQDGAYAGNSQGKHHIGSFIVDGSETNATHTFTSPVTPTNGQVVTATATVLWQIIGVCDGTQQGDGPPYGYCGPT